MYVRLAFAVAAHLESEILIVDEVLAVGDAEFQKKCLGKMGEVSQGEGRTVLFVSHNMTAVKSLCTNALLLQRGVIQKYGSTSEVIDYYLNPPKERSISIPVNAERYGTGEAIFTSFFITNEEHQVIDKVYYLQKYLLVFEFEVRKRMEDFHQFVFWAQIADSQGTPITLLSSIDDGSEPRIFEVGMHKIIAEADTKLIPGSYIINIGLSNMKRNIDNLVNVYSFEVSEIAEDGKKSYPWGANRNGFVLSESRWIY